MAFKGKLVISGKEFNVLNFEYEMSQPTDRNGVPRDRVMGNLMEITIESSSRNQEITEWATEHSMKKDGEIVFSRSDADASGKKIKFQDAYCIYHRDVFDATSAIPMKTTIRLSVLKVEIDGSFSIASPGFDWKKAGLEFAKAAGAAALGMAAGMGTSAATAAIKGQDVDKAEIAKSGIDGAKGIGSGAISSFIPD